MISPKANVDNKIRSVIENRTTGRVSDSILGQILSDLGEGYGLQITGSPGSATVGDNFTAYFGQTAQNLIDVGRAYRVYNNNRYEYNIYGIYRLTSSSQHSVYFSCDGQVTLIVVNNSDNTIASVTTYDDLLTKTSYLDYSTDSSYIPTAQAIKNFAVKKGDYLMPTNFNVVNKAVQINMINNGFYAADKRATVTLTGFKSNADPAKLFDGDYNASCVIESGGTGTVLIEFDSAPGTYTYGKLYVVFYYSGYQPIVANPISVRVYGRARGGGAWGWYSAYTDIKKQNSIEGDNTIFVGSNESVYNITKWEITIQAGNRDVRVSQIEHAWSRGSQQMMPAVTKFAIKQDLYGDVEAPKFIKRGGTSSQFLKADGSVDSTSYAPLTSPAFTGTPTAPTATAGTNTTQIATTEFVKTAIDALPEPMIFKGSLGTGGTITTLPAASSSNEGWTYKVITAGTYAGQTAKVGDTFISTGTEWVLIPSGDEPSGTVISVGAGTGLSISGNASVNPTVNVASGYKLPTTTEWDAKAPLVSPALTGTPTAPTAAVGTNTTQVATTAFVQGTVLWEKGTGTNSVVQKGGSNIASGIKSVSEGYNTTASGDYSHSEGYSGNHQALIASGYASHAEGEGTQSLGRNSHAEGEMGIAYERGAHVEGKTTKAYGMYTHAEGSETEAGFTDSTTGKVWGDQAVHTEGYQSKAVDRYSHAEGYQTYAGYSPNLTRPNVTDQSSPAYGTPNYDVSSSAHAEGYVTKAYGFASHAEGRNTMAKGNYSHAEGQNSQANSAHSHAEGAGTKANATYCHSEGRNTVAGASVSHVEGEGSTVFPGADHSHAEGNNTIVAGQYGHAEGYGNGSTEVAITSVTSETVFVLQSTTGMKVGGYLFYESDGKFITSISGNTVTVNEAYATTPDTTVKLVYVDTGVVGSYSHSEGKTTLAAGGASHSEGEGTITKGDSSHAEGYNSVVEIDDTITSNTLTSKTDANGVCVHVEGNANLAIGSSSHAEGKKNFAKGLYSHAEGLTTKATGAAGHSEGRSTEASGAKSHAEGHASVASGEDAHAEGYYTQATNFAEHSEGQYNKSNKKTTGTEAQKRAGSTVHSIGIGSSSGRLNAFEIMQNGDAYLYGVGNYVGTTIKTGSNNVKTLQDVLSESSPMTSITYSALKTLRDNSQLIPGMQYRITDYNCTTTQPDTQSAGHQFDIIVVANTPSKLNENARATQHSGDTYFANSNLAAWELKYRLDNDTANFEWADATNGKGIIWFMKDENGNECPYDFKNIQFARWERSFDTMYERVFDDEERVWNWQEVSSDVSESYNDLISTFEGYVGLSSSDNKIEFGEIYDDEDAYDYISKYKAIYTIEDTPVYYYTFGTTSDISINSSYPARQNKITYATPRSVKRTLNNIVFASPSNDTECYRNRFDTGSFNMTFGRSCHGNTFGGGCCNNIFGSYCYDNTTSSSFRYNGLGSHCYQSVFGSYNTNNFIASSSSYNTFGDSCRRNTIKDYHSYNIFGNNCHGNTMTYLDYNEYDLATLTNQFGDYCIGITLDTECGGNTFGDGCHDITLNYNNYFNKFGKNCAEITFGNDCYRNTIGECSNNITFGDDCKYNNIGNNCETIKFGTTTTVKSHYNNITIRNNNYRIFLNCTESSLAYNKTYKNVIVSEGFENNVDHVISDSNYNQTTPTIYQPANSQIISI